MEPNDEDLVLACRRGDSIAWETLVRRYQRLIYSIPRRAGLDDDASAEVFQQVFVTLVEKLDSIEQPERIGAWLVTTAKRTTWRMRQRSSATLPLSTDDEADESIDPPDDQPLPEEQMLRLEAQHQVRLALDALDERCRMLLTKLFADPNPPPYSEVAAALRMSEGSIGPTRARCLQKLRQLLVKMEG